MRTLLRLPDDARLHLNIMDDRVQVEKVKIHVQTRSSRRVRSPSGLWMVGERSLRTCPDRKSVNFFCRGNLFNVFCRKSQKHRELLRGISCR